MALIVLAKHSGIKHLREVLNMGADVNVRDSVGNNALMFAVERNDLSMVKFLLRRKINVLNQNRMGCTALMGAAHNGDIKIVSLLLKKSTKEFVNIQNCNGESALIVAARRGHANITQQLLQAGADTELQCLGNDTALYIAAYYLHLPVVKMLLDVGARVPPLDERFELRSDIKDLLAEARVHQLRRVKRAR